MDGIKKQTSHAATAPTRPAVAKATAANAWPTLRGTGNGRPVCFRPMPKEKTTALSSILRVWSRGAASEIAILMKFPAR